MPSASARSMISCESASSVFQPKFMVPRHRRETDRPLRPRWVYSMNTHTGTLGRVPQDDRPTAFDAATTVRRAEGGGLIAELDPGWDAGGGILNGGYLLSVLGRAAGLGGRLPSAGGGAGRVPGDPPPAPGRPVGQLPAGAGGRAGRADRRPGDGGSDP